MFKNAIRQLIRNKLFSFLNILGLTIGISSCWVIYKYVSYELSFEKDLPKKESIYRIISHFKAEGRDDLHSGVSRPIYFYLKANNFGLDEVVPVFRYFVETVTIPATNGREKKQEEPTFEETATIETDKDYFNLIDYNWLEGNKETALTAPHQVVLTEKRAKHYFPKLSNAEILGKTIIYNDSLKKEVSGIVADLSYPTEFTGQEFILIRETERDKNLRTWTHTNGQHKLYVSAKSEGIVHQAVQKVQQFSDAKWIEIKNKELLDYNFTRTLITMPLLESHFSTTMMERDVPKTSKRIIYSLIGVGIFLLVLACINYINLSTAQLPQRHKEIGIRKTLGGSKRSFILQMMCETALVVLIAAFLSFFVSQLGIYLLGDLISESNKAYADPTLFVGIMGGLLIFTILFAGLYPSWMMGKVNPIDIFRTKNLLAVGKEKINLRKGLIIFQFIIAQIFIVGAIIIGQQLNYVVKKDFGFDKDAVILAQVSYKIYKSENFQSKKHALLDEIRKVPGVTNVTFGSEPFSDNYASGEMRYYPTDKSAPIARTVYTKTIDTAYLNFYKLELIAGSNLIPSDTTNGLLINETAVRAYGFKTPAEAIGKVIGQTNRMYPIVGVIKDFHSRDFYTPIEPTALVYDERDLQMYNIKLDNLKKSDWPIIIENIQQRWSKFFPSEEFSYKFYDELVLALYKKEQQLAKMTNISTGIAIVISCLGLFGLATLSTFQRSKEIGIRKVLGASVSGIVGMLSKDFVKLILLAFVIASPIIYWACSKWLNDFVYRIEISGIPFLLGGMLAIFAAMLTIGYQAVKAARANPVDSLRDE